MAKSKNGALKFLAAKLRGIFKGQGCALTHNVLDEEGIEAPLRAAMKASRWLGDRCQLIKLPVSLMSGLAALLGYAVHSLTIPEDSLVMAAGVFCLSGGAAALNNFQDRLQDGIMERTRLRPIPAGRISTMEALLTSSIMIGAGAAALILIGAYPDALLTGLSAIILYNFLYTPLKRKTQLSLIPGVLCGMLPPMVGWLAAGGNPGSPLIWYLMIFFATWQVPHLWLIYLSYGKDFRLMHVPIILDRIPKERLIRLLFLWSAAYGVLMLFMRPFNIIRTDLSFMIVLCSALMMPLTFFIALYVVKSEKKFRILFHYLNILTAGIVCMSIFDSLTAAVGHLR